MTKPQLDHIEHIIWDWNGTLLDDIQICLEIINELMEERGLKAVTLARYREVFGFPVQDYYQRLGFDFDSEPFEIISTLFIENYEKRRPTCRLMSDAEDALSAATKKGITQSILSASKKTYLTKAVREYKIDNYFLSIEGIADHHAAGKLKLAASHLQSLPYSPGAILLIGDTTHDADIARELNLQCALIPNGHHDQERLVKTGFQVDPSLSVLIERIFT